MNTKKRLENTKSKTTYIKIVLKIIPYYAEIVNKKIK